MTTVGILGLGAFGRLMVQHIAPHLSLRVYDPSPQATAHAKENGITLASLEDVAQSDVVIIATPIDAIRAVADSLKPHLKPGALVIDVASVKVLPAQILQDTLPAHVDIVCTHPLFGPQSARNGVAGLKIAVCPVRGKRDQCVVDFLRDKLKLDVIVTTPEDHDRELAAVQGLTHMIAKVLVEMEPLPQKLTTVSFDLMVQAMEMVRHDSVELFLAIERDNPFSAEVRQKFFAKAAALEKYLESHKA